MESNGQTLNEPEVRSLTHEQRLMLRTIGAAFNRQLEEVRASIGSLTGLVQNRSFGESQPVQVVNQVETPAVYLPEVVVTAPTVNVESPTVNVAGPRIRVDTDGIAAVIAESTSALVVALSSAFDRLLALVEAMLAKPPAKVEPVELTILHADGTQSKVRG